MFSKKIVFSAVNAILNYFSRVSVYSGHVLRFAQIHVFIDIGIP